MGREHAHAKVRSIVFYSSYELCSGDLVCCANYFNLYFCLLQPESNHHKMLITPPFHIIVWSLVTGHL